ncbi:MAG TPA: efflux RND transporter periplasmic adaptor subunit [Gemmatimonadales bacterium]
MNRLMGLTLAVAACSQGAAITPDERRPPEPILEVYAEALTTFVAIAGSVVPRERAEITTRMMARIASVPVEIGARVRRGDLLLRLGTDDVEANRRKAEAALVAARAARDEAARHAMRMDTLLAQDAVPRAQRDQAHLGRVQAESQVAMAEATLTDVATAEGYATIRAPFDGTVVSRMADRGDVAAPGMPLLVLESVGARDAVLYLPVTLLGEVAVGDTVRIDTPDGRMVAAPIRALSSGGDARSRTAEARLTLPPDWPTGLSLTARVPAGSHVGVAVPEAAVVRRGQLTGLRVVTGDATVVRWVRLGRTLPDGRVEVLSGLEAGEVIIR